jgi:hypothetical protein
VRSSTVALSSAASDEAIGSGSPVGSMTPNTVPRICPWAQLELWIGRGGVRRDVQVEVFGREPVLIPISVGQVRGP